MRIFATIASLIAILFCSDVYADTSSHNKAAEELLRLMKTEKLMQGMADQMKSMVAQQVKKMNIPEDKAPVFEKHMSRIYEVITSEMSWENIKDDFIAIYVRHFTEEEIKELIEFYQSPIGQKFVEKLPLITRDGMAIGQKNSRNTVSAIQRIIQDMVREIETE